MRHNPSILEFDDLRNDELYMVLTRPGHSGDLMGMEFLDGRCARAFGRQIKRLRNHTTCHAFPVGTPFEWVSDMPIEVVGPERKVWNTEEFPGMTVKQLLHVADKMGISVPKGAKKANLIALLTPG